MLRWLQQKQLHWTLCKCDARSKAIYLDNFKTCTIPHLPTTCYGFGLVNCLRFSKTEYAIYEFEAVIEFKASTKFCHRICLFYYIVYMQIFGVFNISCFLFLLGVFMPVLNNTQEYRLLMQFGLLFLYML